MASNSMDYILNLIANNQQFNAGVNASKFAVNALVSAMAAVGVGVSVKGLIDVADQYATLQARVKVAVGETGNFQQAMAGVYNVALETNTSLDTTASLFARVNDVGKQMGLTQQQVLDVTKTINQAIKIGGGSAQASDAAVTQLTQALQSGVLRGDEFNSIMEQAPGIAKALAASLGVTTGELRKMAENGELSADRVIKALQEQSATIQKEFNQFPTTVSQALQRIQTAWTKLVGEFDQENGASASISALLVEIADNLYIVKQFFDDVADGVGWLGDQLKRVDPATIDALRDAASNAYEAVKEMISVIATAGKEGVVALGDLLNQMLSFMTTAEQAKEGVSGFTKAFQLLNIAIGFLKDGFSAINIGLKFLVGALYDTGSAWLALRAKFAWGEAKDRFIAESNEMAAKARQHFQDAQNDMMKFSSSGIAAYEQSQKSQTQLDEETLNNKVRTLAEIQQAETNALAKQAENNEKRKQLERQLGEAKVTANDAAAAEIRAKLSLLDEQDTAFTKANIERQQEKLRAAQAVADNSIKASNGVLDAETQNHLKVLGFIAEQSDAQKKSGEVTVKAIEDSSKSTEAYGLTASQAAKNAAKALGVDLQVALNEVTKGFEGAKKQVETVVAGFDDLKKNGVDASALVAAAIEELTKKAKTQADIAALKDLIVKLGSEGKLSVDQVTSAFVNLGVAAKKMPAYVDTAKGALEALGVDVGKFSNKLGDDFQEASNHVKTVGSNFKQLGNDGVNAQQALAASLDELLKKAKNQQEIETVRQMYIQFGKDGKLAANDVRLGLQAVEAQTLKLAPATDAAAAAMKRLGLVGREEQSRLAKQMKDDYEIVEQSGKATALELKDAYEKSVNAQISANGGLVDAQLAANAAAKGYAVQIGKNGQVSVEFANSAIEAQNDIVRSLSGIETSTNRVSNSYSRIGNAAISASNVSAQATQQAIDSLDEWANKIDALTRKQGGLTHADALSSNPDADIAGQKGSGRLNQLGLQSYTQQQIYDQLKAIGFNDQRAKASAAEMYRNTSWAATSFGFSDVPGQTGGNDLTNFNYVNAEIARLRKIGSGTSGATNPAKVTNVNLKLGDKTVPVSVDSSQEANLLEMLARAKLVS